MPEYILDGDAIFDKEGALIYDGVSKLNGECIIRHMQAADYYEAQYNAAKQKLDDLRADAARLTQERDAAQAAVNEARDLIDQSLTDCIAILNMNDDPYVAEMLNHLAGQLGLWLAAHPASGIDAADLKTIINLGAAEWRAMEEEATWPIELCPGGCGKPLEDGQLFCDACALKDY